MLEKYMHVSKFIVCMRMSEHAERYRLRSSLLIYEIQTDVCLYLIDQ